MNQLWQNYFYILYLTIKIYSYLIKHVPQYRVFFLGGNYTLHTAHRLFVEKTYQFLQPFLEATKTHYKAELVPVDYMNNHEAARLEINKWVEDQTAQKIKDLIALGVLDSLTRLVLVNAIYFKVYSV